MSSNSRKSPRGRYGRVATAGLATTALGCPSPDFTICTSLMCPDLAIVILSTGFNPGIRDSGILYRHVHKQ